MPPRAVIVYSGAIYGAVCLCGYACLKQPERAERTNLSRRRGFVGLPLCPWFFCSKSTTGLRAATSHMAPGFDGKAVSTAGSLEPLSSANMCFRFELHVC